MASSQLFPHFEASVSLASLKRVKPDVYKRVTINDPFGFDSVNQWYSSGVAIELVAASGLGKSTVLPLTLARGSDVCWILAEVNEFAAAAVHRRMVDINRHDVDLALRLDLSKPFPKSGIVVTTAAVVAAAIAQRFEGFSPSAFGLIIDDALAPLPATSALRRVGPSLSFVSVIAMDVSSCAGVVADACREGKFADATYVPESFKDPWSVTERRSPWSVDAMESHSLILTDDDERATDLMQAYAMSAVPCLRWKTTMSMRNFVADLDYLEKTADRDVVVLADSIFRYAIMVPFGTIIDTAVKFAMTPTQDGKPSVQQEPLSYYELQKSKHRGGHFSGVYTVHWSPKPSTTVSKANSMTTADVEFETLIIAACGFETSRTRALFDLLRSSVVNDVASLLNAEVPLSTAGLRVNIPYNACDDRRQSFGCAIPEVVSSALDDRSNSTIEAFDDLLQSVDDEAAAGNADYEGINFGKYATITDALTLSTKSPLFPNGADSLAKRLSRANDLDVLLDAWDEYDRNVAANIACNSYNAELVSVKALSTVIRDVKADSSQVTSSLRSWSRDIADDLATHVSEARRWYATLIYASHDLFSIAYDKLDFSREEAQIVRSRRGACPTRSAASAKPTINQMADARTFVGTLKSVKSSSQSGSSRTSVRSASDSGKSVRFQPSKRISDLPGYNFNALVVSWVGGKTKQYRRSLERAAAGSGAT